MKIKKIIINFIINSLLPNVAGIILLGMLIELVKLMSMIQIENLWNKILAICYVAAVIVFLIVLGIPKTGKRFAFNKMSTISFLVWCVIIPIIVGVIIGAIIVKIRPNMPVDDVGVWSIAICVTIISFIWFLTKLYRKADVTSYLDWYSTLWIAVLTILTTLFDLQEKKAAFVFLLAMYFILQWLIKGRICKFQKDKVSTDCAK